MRWVISASLDKAELRAWIGQKAVGRVKQIMDTESGRLEELESECKLVHGDFDATKNWMIDGAVSGAFD